MKNGTENTITISLEEYKRLLDLQREVLYLKTELEQLKRMIFGAKSERFVPADSGQLSLFETAQTPETVAEPQTVSYTPAQPKAKKKGHARPVIAAHLPRVVEIHEPENLTPDMRKIGEERTEVLEYEPGRLFVRLIILPKYVSKNPEAGITVAQLPTLPLPRANADAGLLTHILISKFIDSLPFYRISAQFKRQGVHIAESTINGWFSASCTLLEPLYDCLVKKVRQSNYLMADETPIPVLESDKKGSTHTGYHWAYYAPQEKIACFQYKPGRAGAWPKEFLSDFKGGLQTDGYVGYEQFESNTDITLLACMAHARRKFEQALTNDKPRAEHMLKLMQQLYATERKARETIMTNEQRYELRQTESVPVLQQMEAWLRTELQAVLPKSPIGKAIQYTLGLWHRLKRYTENGSYEIDNNLVENSIRPIALGRKNYLFAGSHKAAQHAAMMYSFFATCKLNEIEPFQWLKNVIKAIPDHKANKLEELLPTKNTSNGA
jgi:transposase